MLFLLLERNNVILKLAAIKPGALYPCIMRNVAKCQNWAPPTFSLCANTILYSRMIGYQNGRTDLKTKKATGCCYPKKNMSATMLTENGGEQHFSSFHRNRLGQVTSCQERQIRLDHAWICQFGMARLGQIFLYEVRLGQIMPRLSQILLS